MYIYIYIYIYIHIHIHIYVCMIKMEDMHLMHRKQFIKTRIYIFLMQNLSFITFKPRNRMWSHRQPASAQCASICCASKSGQLDQPRPWSSTLLCCASKSGHLNQSRRRQHNRSWPLPSPTQRRTPSWQMLVKNERTVSKKADLYTTPRELKELKQKWLRISRRLQFSAGFM